MRLFLLLILFLNTALAGFPPTTLKGQGQSSSTTTFNFQVPAKQATKTSTGTLIETGNKNKLSNAGFEHSTFNTDVTTSGSSISLAEETTIIHSGLKSAKATFTASTNGLVKLVSSAGSYDVQQFQGKVWIYNEDGVTTASVCSLSGTTVGNCQSIISTTGWNEYAVPFVGSATGENGIVIGTTGAAITGDFYIDDAEVFTGGTNYVTATNQDYDWTSYGTTGDFTGFGTPTGIALYHKRQGSDLLIRGNFSCGTTTATEARLNLPNSLTSTSTISAVELAGFATSSNTGGDTVPLILIEPSKGYMTFGYKTSGQSGLTKQNGSAYCSSGNTISFNAKFSINGWNTPNQVIATVKDVVTIPSTPNGKPIEFGAETSTDCTTGTCSLSYNYGGIISSITWLATGVYTINFTGLTGIYSCNSGSRDSGGNVIYNTNTRSISTSSAIIDIGDAETNVGVNKRFFIDCKGY